MGLMPKNSCIARVAAMGKRKEKGKTKPSISSMEVPVCLLKRDTERIMNQGIKYLHCIDSKSWHRADAKS